MKIIRESLKIFMIETQNQINVFDLPPTSTELSKVKGVVLVTNPADQLLYHAVIRNNLGDKTCTNIQCFFVDYGFARKIHYSRIFRPTILLEKYPRQAIETQLHGIEDFNADILLHLRSLLKPQGSAYMEVIETEIESGIPFVRVYRMVDACNSFGSINDFLEMKTS